MPHDMQFCDQCNNLLFINPDPDGTYYMCLCCNKRFNLFGASSMRISHTVLKRQGAPSDSDLTGAVLGDPTLPVTALIACPNPGCTKRKDAENKVIYINHDPVNMSFTYSCVHCKHMWALSNRGDA